MQVPPNNSSMNTIRKKRVSRDDWLKTALQMFASNGEGGLHVEKLAREVGVAKSGFYFHFKDRADLLKQMLEYWSYEYTEVVTKNSLLLMAPPAQRLTMIATHVFDQHLTEFDAAMLVWSKKDKAIARKVTQVIRFRHNFVRQIFRELGLDDEEVEIRSRIFLGYITASRDNFGPNAKSAQAANERLIEMLTRDL